MVWRESISRWMAVMREAKKSVAKAAEPTGWPRRRQPEVKFDGDRGGGGVGRVGSDGESSNSVGEGCGK